MTKIKRVQQIVKEILENDKSHSLAHQWDHIKRVYNIALRIARFYQHQEILDLEVLKLAIFLHDIGETCNNKKNHQKISALIASQILKDVGYSDETIEKVCQIIVEHSSENNLSRLSPSSLESKILFDADKIDGVGAVGIARALILCGQQGKSPKECLDWYQDKIKLDFGQNNPVPATGRVPMWSHHPYNRAVSGLS